MNLLTYLLFFAILKLSSSKTQQIDCKEPFKNYTKPWECCYYPFLYIGNTSAQSCPKECVSRKDDKCCVYDCVAKKLKIYKNEEFYGENLAKFYESNVKAEWEMSIEKWMPVIRDSVERCEKIGEDFLC